MTNADTKTREKLSVVPKGAWRNRYLALIRMVLEDDDGTCEHVFPGEEFLGSGRWPSREVAEEVAMESAPKSGPRYPSHFECRYLGAQFFPDP